MRPFTENARPSGWLDFFRAGLTPVCILIVASLLAAATISPSNSTSSGPKPTPQELFQRAAEAQQQGRLKLAAREYEELLRMQPNVVGAHANLGVVLVGLGRFDEAIAQYRAALALAPGNRALQFDLALAYYKKKDFTAAADRISQLRRSEPDDLRLAILLGDCDLNLGHSGEAVALLQPFEAGHPDDLDLTWVLGQALIRTGHASQGVQRIEKVAEQRNSAEAYALAAKTWIQLEDFGHARRDLDAAMRLNPHLGGLETLDGMIRSYSGDDAGAAASFQKALAADPNDFEAHLYLGSVLYTERKLDAARSHLDRALQMQPTSSLARYERARVEAAQQQTAAAVKDLEEAVRADPDWLKPHIELAALYYRIKRPQDGARERKIVDRLSAELQQRKAAEGGFSAMAPAP